MSHVLANASSRSRTLRLVRLSSLLSELKGKIVSARRRNQHATRARFPESTDPTRCEQLQRGDYKFLLLVARDDLRRRLTQSDFVGHPLNFRVLLFQVGLHFLPLLGNGRLELPLLLRHNEL